jgi:hypothetical protein
MSRDYIGLNRMKQTPHPPCSPDLAPSDIFLFGDVKGKLMEYRAETPSELLVRIRVILAEIQRETWNAVFLEWMEPLQNCVQVDVSMSDELKERNLLKMILIMKFACATLDVGHPIESSQEPLGRRSPWTFSEVPRELTTEPLWFTRPVWRREFAQIGKMASRVGVIAIPGWRPRQKAV